ncbi:MAG: biotin--[acetyl-CoA-carboxylase] ligase [Myxococcales bacterium]|nr:biotin--[acetyl-CoA-carboxylase] ligase [Myxococcales bacterium]
MSWLGAARQAHDTCASTNDLALAWARAGAPHGAIVIADAQRAGRGRHGRAWASPPGRSLYLSIVVRLGPTVPVPPLTLAIGVGVCDAIRGEGVTAAGLKWPNDVLVGGKKLAGVLCESTADAVVVGVGVNANGAAADLPPEVSARATTIADELGRWIEREALLERLLAELAPWIERYQAGGVAAIAPAWTERMVPDLRVRTDRATGIARGIDRAGALEVEDDAGALHRVSSGDVEWIV